MPRRWIPAVAPQDTGVLVHGSMLLTQAPGIRVELDHAQAHSQPPGLMLHLQLHADGVHAEAAQRQMIDGPRQVLDPAGGRAVGSEPVLRMALNDLGGQVHAKTSSARAHENATGELIFTMKARYWVDELPTDSRVHLGISWPQAGLPEAAHTLLLAPPTS